MQRGMPIVNLNLTVERDVLDNVGEIMAYDNDNRGEGLVLQNNCFVGKPPMVAQYYSARTSNLIRFNSIYVAKSLIDDGTFQTSS